MSESPFSLTYPIAPKTASMRNTLLLLLLGSTLCQSALLAQQTAKSFNYGDYMKLGYLEYLPPGYDTTTHTYPVLIFLHGGGEGGDGSPEQLEKVKSWGPPRHIAAGHDMCFTVDGKAECFIVISPQINTTIYNWTIFVPLVIDHVLNGPEAYRVDPDRIYLTGLSRGGHGVYSFASSQLNEPNKLAAIAPIAAWSEADYDGCIISKRRIPVWAFHGEKDTVIPYVQGTTAFNEIKNCANPEPEAELIFTTYEDRYHDSWIPAYDPWHVYHNPNLYEWLLLQRRVVPDVVTSANDTAPNLHAFSFYPNPADRSIYLSFNESSTAKKTITIRSLTGQRMMTVTEDHNEVDISVLSPGVYIVEMKNHSGIVSTERLVKVGR